MIGLSTRNVAPASGVAFALTRPRVDSAARASASLSALCCACACVLCAGVAGHAVAQPAARHSVDEVVVTATRTPTALDRIGSSVTVLTDLDLERQQIRYVSDALQSVPGIAVSQYGSRGTSSSVRLRGQGSEATLVLIDGIEVSDPSQPQTAFDFSHLTSAGVERIEVLRGSQSVLYGGDAVGGVISVTTRRGTGTPQGSIDLEGGRFGTRSLGTSVGGGAFDDRFGYRLNVERVETDGFSAADEALPGNTEGEAYENLSLNGTFTFTASEAVLVTGAFRAAEGTLNYDACGGEFCDDPDLGDEFEQQSARIATSFIASDRFRAELGIAQARTERRGFDDGAPSGEWLGTRDKIDFAGTVALAAGRTLVFGAELEEESMRTTSIGRREAAGIDGYYTMVQISPSDALHLTFGGRLDRHEFFGSFDTYRATAAYALGASGVRLKASASTGFRAPSLFELFGAAFGEAVGNTGLEPEQSESVELGFERTAGERGTFGVTVFRIDTDDEIRFDAGTFGNGDAPNYFNIGATRSSGVEIAGDWAAAERISLGLSYTYNEAEDERGVPLDNRPKHLVALSLHYAFRDDRGGVSVNVRHMADTLDTDLGAFPSRRVALEDPVVANVAASYLVTQRLELKLRVENVLDEQYQTELGYGTADRAAYAGVRYRF